MRHFFSWIGRLADGVSLFTAAGLTMTGVLAVFSGWWANAAQGGYILGVCVGLFIFGSILWAWIGLVWMVDRDRRLSPRHSKEPINCAWGLRVEAVFLIHDIGNTEISWQFQVGLRNVMEMPLRLEVVGERKLIVEGKLPDCPLSGPQVPSVTGSNQVSGVNFPGYSELAIFNKERISGDISFGVKYGHPDGPYTRIMYRTYRITAVLQPPNPVGITGNLFPMSGHILVPFYSLVEDTDEPFEDTLPRLPQRSQISQS